MNSTIHALIPAQTKEQAQVLWDRIELHGRAAANGSYSCFLCTGKVFVYEGDQILHLRCQSILVTRRHRRGMVGF